LATDRRTAWINAPAADVWGIISNSEALPDWFPGIASCRMAGDQRICELHRGGPVIEDIVTCDHDLRRLQYHIASGIPVAEHLGTVDVIADGDKRCLVVYGTDVLPAELGPALGNVVDRALAGLAELLRGGRREGSP
jgi:polyketide cyclase/dehydrase/lipid transport protein